MDRVVFYEWIDGMLSPASQKILRLLQVNLEMYGSDIEDSTGLSEETIKISAIELAQQKLLTTSGASNGNEDSGEAIDRLSITSLGKAYRSIL